MSAERDTRLALELSRLVNELDDEEEGPEASSSREHLLRCIGHFAELARISTELQAQTIRSAHEAGVSWSRIGGHLGISRQAVQQRFDPGYQEAEPEDDKTRILGPVSRAEEVDHLNAAGAQGWRPVRSLPGQHVLRWEGGQWEVRRVSVLTALGMPSEKKGWQASTTRFPDCFYVRQRNS